MAVPCHHVVMGVKKPTNGGCKMKCFTYHNGVLEEGLNVTMAEDRKRGIEIPVVYLGSENKVFYHLRLSIHHPPVITGMRVLEAFPFIVDSRKEPSTRPKFPVLAKPKYEMKGQALVRILTSTPSKMTGSGKIEVLSGHPQRVAFGSGYERDRGGPVYLDEVWRLKSTPINDALVITINGCKTVIKMGQSLTAMAYEQYVMAVDAMGGRAVDSSSEDEGDDGLLSDEEMSVALEPTDDQK